MDITLSPEQIKQNYEKLRGRIDKIFKTRAEQLHKMYDYFEERIIFAPASSFAHFHNAFPGGYIDHILRVMDFAVAQHKMWESMGLKTDNYTLEELMFAAMHHDLGKLGMPVPGGELYIVNDSEWHRNNQGKEFKTNQHLPQCTIQDRSLFLLQHFGIPVSWNEYLGIRIHDGMYDEANKYFYMAFSVEGKLRNNLPIILHHADMMASRYEFERWAAKSNSFNMDSIDSIKIPAPSVSTKSKPKPHPTVSNKVFNDLFKND